jgi:8-oxo-dGTP pyrophosphatase MutT (NUDIX family)
MSIVSHAVRQAAVLAFRSGRVCLVLSGGGKRWVLPKGHIERGQSAGEAALQEAWEEAGLVGSLAREPLGSYLYEKCDQTFHVTVFRMHVTEAARQWPERQRRTRRWVRPSRLPYHLDEGGLCQLMRRLLAAQPRRVMA